jgi:hypothetical protein
MKLENTEEPTYLKGVHKEEKKPAAEPPYAGETLPVYGDFALILLDNIGGLTAKGR